MLDMSESSDHPRRSGRPAVGPATTLRLPPELLARVDQYAAGQGVTRAAAIRELLAEAFARRDQLAEEGFDKLTRGRGRRQMRRSRPVKDLQPADEERRVQLADRLGIPEE
jgi:predicted transcriptional regulator